jgi:predicted lipoprotein with Yx(FWY)xxD motif
MRRASLAAIFALAVAGCGEDERDGPASGSSAPAQTTAAPKLPVPEPEAKERAKSGTPVRIVDSQFGRVVADRHGEALYLFDAEEGAKPECYGACAEAWPPFLTKGKPTALEGADAKLLGTTRRRDGKLQVTYRGHPLYYYVSDSPGKILCQDVDEFGGTWLVVQPSGDPVS